jgi:hypothetical protein
MNLKAWIDQKKKEGYTENQIRNNLIGDGYSHEHINPHFAEEQFDTSFNLYDTIKKIGLIHIITSFLLIILFIIIFPNNWIGKIMLISVFACLLIAYHYYQHKNLVRIMVIIAQYILLSGLMIPFSLICLPYYYKSKKSIHFQSLVMLFYISTVYAGFAYLLVFIIVGYGILPIIGVISVFAFTMIHAVLIAIIFCVLLYLLIYFINKVKTFDKDVFFRFHFILLRPLNIGNSNTTAKTLRNKCIVLCITAVTIAFIFASITGYMFVSKNSESYKSNIYGMSINYVSEYEKYVRGLLKDEIIKSNFTHTVTIAPVFVNDTDIRSFISNTEFIGEVFYNCNVHLECKDSVQNSMGYGKAITASDNYDEIKRKGETLLVIFSKEGRLENVKKVYVVPLFEETELGKYSVMYNRKYTSLSIFNDLNKYYENLYEENFDQQYNLSFTEKLKVVYTREMIHSISDTIIRITNLGIGLGFFQQYVGICEDLYETIIINKIDPVHILEEKNTVDAIYAGMVIPEKEEYSEKDIIKKIKNPERTNPSGFFGGVKNNLFSGESVLKKISLQWKSHLYFMHVITRMGLELGYIKNIHVNKSLIYLYNNLDEKESDLSRSIRMLVLLNPYLIYQSHEEVSDFEEELTVDRTYIRYDCYRDSSICNREYSLIPLSAVKKSYELYLQDNEIYIPAKEMEGLIGLSNQYFIGIRNTGSEACYYLDLEGTYIEEERSVYSKKVRKIEQDYTDWLVSFSNPIKIASGSIGIIQYGIKPNFGSLALHEMNITIWKGERCNVKEKSFSLNEETNWKYVNDNLFVDDEELTLVHKENISVIVW